MLERDWCRSRPVFRLKRSFNYLNPAVLRLLLSAVFLCFLASQSVAQDIEYTLGSGDKLRVIVFGEEDLSGEFEVDGRGNISMPLIGQMNVKNLSARKTERIVEDKLRDGFLKNPKVSIEVLNYRPFYILGEVKKPGNYPYVDGMTVLNAVAIANGYTYRANKKDILIVRANDPSKKERKITTDTRILPGDIVRIKERFF